MSRHREVTVLVAFTVEIDEPDPDKVVEEVQEQLMRMLVPLLAGRNPHSPITEWWIAEDERYDGSDNDSAVFVPKGTQELFQQILDIPGFPDWLRRSL